MDNNFKADRGCFDDFGHFQFGFFDWEFDCHNLALVFPF